MTKMTKIAVACCQALLMITFAPMAAAATFTFNQSQSSVDPNYQFVVASYTVGNLAATDISDDPTQQLSQIGIIVYDSDQQKPILPGPGCTVPTTTGTTGTATSYNTNFCWNADAAVARKQPVGNGTYNFVVTVRITVAPTAVAGTTFQTLLKPDQTTKKQSIRFLPQFTPFNNGSFGTPQTSSDTPYTITLNFAAPTDQPQGFSVTAQDRAVQVNWTVPSSVKYNDGTTSVPGTVQIMTFDASAGPIDLPGQELTSAITGAKISAHCHYSGSVVDGSNCLKCDDPATSGNPVFISSTKPSNADVLRYDSGLPNNGSYLVQPLTVGKELVMAMMYTQGTKPSICKRVTPVATVSLTEMEGGPSAVPKNPVCFIVSATYGSPFAPDVEVYRWFRDTYLMTWGWGQKFVAFYYDHAPPVAKAIEERPWLKKTFQALLYLPTRLLKALQTSTETEEKNKSR